MNDTRNVQDKYKNWLTELIREDVVKNTFPYSVLMVNLNFDFNLGTFIRNGNAFGAKEIYYLQPKKRWDVRSAVGTQHYSSINYLKTEEEVFKLLDKHIFIGVELTEDAENIYDFVYPENPLLIFGSEGLGIPSSILDKCQKKIYIPMPGSVRSLNVGTSSGIVFNDFLMKYGRKNGQF